MSFYLAEVSALRDLDHESISKNLKHRRQWRYLSFQRYGKDLKDISIEKEKHLHALCDVLTNADYEYKYVVSTNCMWVYANDIDFFQALDNCEFLSYKQFTQVNINRPKNTISIKKAKHTHRSYFKIIKLSAESKQILANFLSAQPEIRPSPSLEKWFQSKFTRTQDYFFIDHNGENYLLMLSLVLPGILRKTLQIIAHK